MITCTIRGIRELQLKNQAMIRTLHPNDSLGEGIRYAALHVQTAAMIKTPVDTGALRASHRIGLINGKQNEMRIYIDPTTRNPKHGKPPAVYGIVVHDRMGGRRAFYKRVIDEDADRIVEGAINIIMNGLRRSA